MGQKSEFNCLVSFTRLLTCCTNSWYFDSGCSRHMIGDNNILVDYKPLLEGLVTFGDGVTTRVLSRGTLNIDGFPRLKNVLHVDGLKSNLISINQICDLNLNLNFNREKCVVLVFYWCPQKIKGILHRPQPLGYYRPLKSVKYGWSSLNEAG